MVTVQIGSHWQASLDRGQWSSQRPMLRRVLQQATDALDVPEWVVDDELYVVAWLARHLPMSVLATADVHDAALAS